MKKTNIKTIIVFICTTFGIANMAVGQSYSNGTFFYKQVNSDYITIWQFNGKEALFKCSVAIPNDSEKNIRKVLGVDPNAFERSDSPGNHYVEGNIEIGWRTIHVYMANYRSDIPSDSRSVYKIEGYDYYCAVSYDLSNLVIWREENGLIKDKRYFTRIPKEDLLPKAANYDFLNE